MLFTLQKEYYCPKCNSVLSSGWDCDMCLRQVPLTPMVAKETLSFGVPGTGVKYFVPVTRKLDQHDRDTLNCHISTLVSHVMFKKNYSIAKGCKMFRQISTFAQTGR
jgi:hypothetical protein